MQLQSDDEQKKDDAEFGEVQDVFHVGYEAQTPGTDQHTGEEVAENSAEAELAGEDNRDYRRCQIDGCIMQYHVDVLRRGIGIGTPN